MSSHVSLICMGVCKGVVEKGAQIEHSLKHGLISSFLTFTMGWRTCHFMIPLGLSMVRLNLERRYKATRDCNTVVEK
jgi:hypothetical protein